MINNKTVIKEAPFKTVTAGMEALRERLGVIGVAEFFQYFGLGYGNYTEERRSLLDGLTVDDVCAEIRAREAFKA